MSNQPYLHLFVENKILRQPKLQNRIYRVGILETGSYTQSDTCLALSNFHIVEILWNPITADIPNIYAIVCNDHC